MESAFCREKRSGGVEPRAGSEMRIRVVHLLNQVAVGGCETGLMAMLPHFDHERFEYQVYYLFDHPHTLVEAIEKAAVPVRSMRLWSMIDLLGVLRLRRALRDFAPHILHTHLMGADLLGRLLAPGVNIRTVVTSLRNEAAYYFPQTGWLQRARGASYRWVVTHTPGEFATVSERVQESFEPMSPRFHGMHILHNAIDVNAVLRVTEEEAEQQRRRLALEPHQRLVISVARLVPNKGHAHLLAAIPQVLARVPDTVFAFVGDGGQRGALQAQVNDMGLAEHVRLLGSLRPTTVFVLLKIATAFINSSLAEGLPMSLVEAMAAGLPVVATAVGGVPELVEDQVTGYLVPPRSPEALAEALTSVLTDPQKRRQMGEAAQRKSLERHHPSNVARRHEELYLKLLADQPEAV